MDQINLIILLFILERCIFLSMCKCFFYKSLHYRIVNPVFIGSDFTESELYNYTAKKEKEQ